MSDKICKECGAIMDRGTDMVYIVYSCSSCGWGFETDEYVSIYGEYDEDDILSRPINCRNCDSNYPLCTTSCPAFDK